MRERFETLADAAVASLRSGEHCTVGFVGEKTDFARLNRGRVRQAGTVDQTALTVRLVEGRRHVARQLSLSGTDRDTQMVAATIASLRDVLPHLPEDPFLDIHQSESGDTDAGAHDAVDGMDAVAQVIDFASAGGQRLDLVGIWASGRVARGFASSWGQRSWFARSSWSLDFCVVHAGDKAVKRTVSGLVWEPRQVAAAIQTARAELVALGRPIKKIAPGAYRSWLTPAATGEIWKLIRGGFGKRGLATLTSPLLSLAQGKSRFDERISVREHVSGGMAPGFNGDGWPRLASVELVERGKLVGALVSSRSAREFGIPGTGAGSSESP
jgi:predicted Zn-dependent protease